MATTTNYGWTTPDNTALVKDGASAIRTLGSSVDTTVKALSPGTTAGDIDYYTSSTAKSRLAIGTTGQVLTVAGGVPSWATSSSGSMTQLATGSLSGATVTLSSIASGYEHLYLRINGVSMSGASEVRLQINGVTSDYRSGVGSGASALPMSMAAGAGTSTTSGAIWFYDYLKTSCLKVIGYNTFNNSDGTFNTSAGAGSTQANTAVITSITIVANAGTFDAGTYQLFGVK